MTSPTRRVLAGRFEIQDRLGGGGFGEVFLAHDLSLVREVAIKIFRPDVVREGDPVWLEARAAAGIKSPYVTAVHDLVLAGDVVFLVYEFVAGPTLEALMRARRLTLAECRRIFNEMCLGVEEAHRASVLHRDLKPSNVLLTGYPLSASGAPALKITDFGLAKLRDQATFQTMRHLGTPAYMSPEQFEGRASGAATDVYALGVTLFEMLTGSLPFPSGDMRYRHVHEAPPALENLPAQLSAVVQKAMAKKMEDRYQRVEDLRQAIVQAMDGGNVQAGTKVLNPEGTPEEKSGSKSGGPATGDTQSGRAYLDGVALNVQVRAGIEGFPAGSKMTLSEPDRTFGAVRLWNLSRRSYLRVDHLVVAAVTLGGRTGMGPGDLPRADVLEQVEHHTTGIVGFDPTFQYRIGIFSPSGWPDTWTQYPLANTRVRYYLVDKPEEGVPVWRVRSDSQDDPLRRIFNPESDSAATRRIRVALDRERGLRQVGDSLPLGQFALSHYVEPAFVGSVIDAWDGRFKVVGGQTIQRRKES